MRARHVNRCCLTAFLLLCSSTGSLASGMSCDTQVSIARMARANDASDLLRSKKHTGTDYVSLSVAAAKMFMLQPRDPQAADALLALIPQTTEQNENLTNLYDPTCAGLSIADMRSLDRLSARLPSLFAAAVILIPKRLSQYISYSLVAVSDPHNDHTIQMRRVCRTMRGEFAQAVNHLARDERAEFRTRVFDDKKCRPIHLPEDD